MEKITALRHPRYMYQFMDWYKYRLIKDGGDAFIDAYLKKFSTREDDTDFLERRGITYNPAFAKSAIEEVDNAIYQRITEVRRLTESKVYTDMMLGLSGGVNRKGTTMNSFIGREILHELTFIGKVGVYVDMPEVTGTTIKDNLGKTPYMYKYNAEDILSWQSNIDDPSEFQSVLLREEIEDIQDSLVCSNKTRYRHCYIKDKLVHVDFYNDKNELIDKDFNKVIQGYTLQLSKIPFTIFELNQSLLTDVANYQIALLNLASSDMNYGVKANFPFYIEQTDFNQLTHIKLPGEETSESTSRDPELKVGVVQGRRYGRNVDPPSFISPPSEPLMASMAKQEQLRHEIRALVHLSLSNVMGKSASAESKGIDNQGLESGLSYIALELEAGERKIAEHVVAYLGDKKPVTIKYPIRYNLQTEDERFKEIEQIEKRIPSIPSKTYQKAMAKELVLKLLGHKISEDDLQKIYSEIDEAPGIVNSDTVIKDVEAGFLSKATAAKLRLYPKGEHTVADAEHTERLKEIAASQSVRGVPDTQTTNVSKDDKSKTPKRGEGRFGE